MYLVQLYHQFFMIVYQMQWTYYCSRRLDGKDNTHIWMIPNSTSGRVKRHFSSPQSGPVNSVLQRHKLLAVHSPPFLHGTSQTGGHVLRPPAKTVPSLIHWPPVHKREKDLVPLVFVQTMDACFWPDSVRLWKSFYYY